MQRRSETIWRCSSEAQAAGGHARFAAHTVVPKPAALNAGTRGPRLNSWLGGCEDGAATSPVAAFSLPGSEVVDLMLRTGSKERSHHNDRHHICRGRCELWRPLYSQLLEPFGDQDFEPLLLTVYVYAALCGQICFFWLLRIAAYPAGRDETATTRAEGLSQSFSRMSHWQNTATVVTNLAFTTASPARYTVSSDRAWERTVLEPSTTCKPANGKSKEP